MIIYYFKNKINGKGYVGQHCGDGEIRKNSHLRESLNLENPAPLYKSFRKYGSENFEYEILEQIPLEQGQNYLDLREIYWIHTKNTYIGNNQGYNRTLGGGGGVRAYCMTKESKPKEYKFKWGQYNKNGDLLNIFNSARQASSVLDFNNFRNIYHAASWHEGIGKQSKTAGGFMWKRVPIDQELPSKITPIDRLGNKPRIDPLSQNTKKGSAMKSKNFEIAQYNFNGNLIRIWPNNAEMIGRELEIDGDKIRINLRGETFLTGGFMWKRFPIMTSPNKLPRSPMQVDGFRLDEEIFYNEPIILMNLMDNDIIERYPSISKIDMPFMEQVNVYQEALSMKNINKDYIHWIFEKDLQSFIDRLSEQKNILRIRNLIK